MKPSRIAIFLSIVIVIQFLAHLVVYEALRSVFPSLSAGGVTDLRVVVSVLGASFVVMIFITRSFNNFLTRSLYRIAAVWEGMLLYFFFAAVLVLLAQLFAPSVTPIFGMVLFAIATIVGIYGVLHARDTKIKKVSVALPHLPESWKTKKVVWISDVHLGQVNAEKFAAKVTAMVSALEPSMIFIGGDLYDGVKVDTEKIIEPLRNLKAPDGTYFITGNHDGFTARSTVEDVAAIERIGITVLQDRMIEVAGVQIIGVDYRNTVSRDNFARVLKSMNIDPAKPSILLKHVPSDVDVAAQAGVSLQVSGHTHKGQVWPFSYLPKRAYKGFDYGLKKLGDLSVYVSSGVGTWGPPLRVGTQSEIVVFHFE